MPNVLINNETMVAIANSIRNKMGTSDSFKPSEMPSAIEGIQTGGEVSEILENDWNRPTAWLPYDKDIDWETFEGCYLMYDSTYHTTSTANFIAFTVGLSGGQYQVDFGTVTKDGTFNIAETQVINSGGTYSKSLSDNSLGKYVIARITPVNDAHIKTIVAADNTDPYYSKGTQPLIERYGRLPNFNYTLFNAPSLKHDDVRNAKVTTLDSTFRNISTQLECIDAYDWDTGSVKSMNYCFYNSSTLKAFRGMETWDLANVASFNQAFAGAKALKIPKVEISDLYFTTGTNVIGNAFQNSGIQEIVLKNWDLYDSSTTTSSYFIASSPYLKKVDLSGWDVRKIVTLPYLFQACSSLEVLDMTGWDLQSMTKCDFGTYTTALIDFYPPNVYCDFKLTQSQNLSYESLLRVLNMLPQTEEGQTLTLTLNAQSKKKLNDAEKAIATQKGWTIA